METGPTFVSSLVVNFGNNDREKDVKKGHRRTPIPLVLSQLDPENEQPCHLKVGEILKPAVTQPSQIDCSSSEMRNLSNFSTYDAEESSAALSKRSESVVNGNIAENMAIASGTSAFDSQEILFKSNGLRSGEEQDQVLEQNMPACEMFSAEKNYSQIYNNIRRQQVSEKSSSVVLEESTANSFNSIYAKENLLSDINSAREQQCVMMYGNQELLMQQEKNESAKILEADHVAFASDVQQETLAVGQLSTTSTRVHAKTSSETMMVEKRQASVQENSIVQQTKSTGCLHDANKAVLNGKKCEVEHFALQSETSEEITGESRGDTTHNRNLHEQAENVHYHQSLNYNQNGMMGEDSSVTAIKSRTDNASSQFETTDFIYPVQHGNYGVDDDINKSEDSSQPPRIISIFKGHVKLKSKGFESSGWTAAKVKNYADLSADLDGIVHESVAALQTHTHEDRHESQITGDDANEVDGHVKMKQTLFETLPVHALYEHGQTHSSQIITRGRRKSNLGEVLNEFNTKALAEINDRECNQPEKDVVDFDVCNAVTSFKTMHGQGHQVCKKELHESQRVDEDIPFNNNLVKENAERFSRSDFSYKTNYQSSQNVTEEERTTASGLFSSMKGEFENKPLDFIGFDDRPERHPSQLIEDEHMRKATNEIECQDFVLSEPHPSQQISYHEEMLNGRTQVREKRRQYYDYCNSPVRCMSRELVEDSEILNSSELSGIVRHTAAVYLDEGLDKSHDRQGQTKKYSNDVYVKPLRNKFETQTVSQLSIREDLHSSQCTDHPDGLLEETQKQHCSDSNEYPSLHMSQVINPAEYAAIRSDVGAKRHVFSSMTPSNLAPNPRQHCENPHNHIDTQVKPIKEAFELCKTQNHSMLHQSQIVGHDIHLISSSGVEESHLGVEKSELHESQKVNYGIVRPTTHDVEQVESSLSDFVNPVINVRTTAQCRTLKFSKSHEESEKDLELLLNYKPVVQQELPSMVTVMVKGVPSELIESGHPILTEYVTDSTIGKRISIGSRTSTPVRNSSINSCPESRFENMTPPVAHRRCQESNVETSMSHFHQSTGKDFVTEPELFSSSPLNDSPSLPSYPDSGSPGSNCDFTDDSLPPPPMFENVDSGEYANNSCPDFVESAHHPDFVVGSTVSNPSRCNNIISAPDAELTFWSLEQENSLRERFSKRSNRQITSSAESCKAFLRVREDEFNRKISSATVESYPESDDQWDFVA